ncbi:hypothetical protein TNCT_49481 [Trichonephila clavata]|uniref:Uncharacterized protein n=1 Tax=Trichonephila clavata TaxID=2740835 RepID=A0A8X6FY49_TRICU|nr:hypothetical protein TNCT_49481 [Trichonephila clavata]
MLTDCRGVVQYESLCIGLMIYKDYYFSVSSHMSGEIIENDLKCGAITHGFLLHDNAPYHIPYNILGFSTKNSMTPNTPYSPDMVP